MGRPEKQNRSAPCAGAGCPSLLTLPWLFLMTAALFGLLVMPGGKARAARAGGVEAELQSLRTQLQLLEKREEEYRKEVLELGQTLDRVSQQSAQGQADQLAALNELRSRLEALDQSLRELGQQQTELAGRMRGLEDQLESELTGIKSRLDRLDGGVEPGAAAPAGPTPAKDYKAVYALAVEQFKAKNYEAARAQFEAFLKAYPQTELSDNAQLGIGECYFALGQFDKAALEYDKVRKNFATGNKVPNALWKMALAFDQLGQREAAKGFLKELIEKFPAAPEAELAKKKLASWP